MVVAVDAVTTVAVVRDVWYTTFEKKMARRLFRSVCSCRSEPGRLVFVWVDNLHY
jgi:hypothetical protein